jgi:hypothetical protein
MSGPQSIGIIRLQLTIFSHETIIQTFRNKLLRVAVICYVQSVQILIKRVLEQLLRVDCNIITTRPIPIETWRRQC